jgi:hypothetical protein
MTVVVSSFFARGKGVRLLRYFFSSQTTKKLLTIRRQKKSSEEEEETSARARAQRDEMCTVKAI